MAALSGQNAQNAQNAWGSAGTTTGTATSTGTGADSGVNSSAGVFSRRARVPDEGRRRQGTMQRLELAMGLVGAFVILALLTLVMALVQGAGSALTTAAGIFLVAAVVLIAVAIWYRKLR